MKELILKYLIEAAYFGLKAAIDGGLVDEIKQLVNAAFDFDMPGKEKKDKVMLELKDIGGVIGEAVSEMTGWFLSTVVDIFVAKAKIDRGEPILKNVGE